MRNKLIKLLGGYTKADFRYHKNKLDELTTARKNCGSVNLDLKWLDELTANERKNILSEADDIFSKGSLSKICNELKKRQIFHIAEQASGISEMTFGRGTLNGVSLLEGEIESLATLNRQENSEQEDFDPYSLIN